MPALHPLNDRLVRLEASLTAIHEQQARTFQAIDEVRVLISRMATVEASSVHTRELVNSNRADYVALEKRLAAQERMLSSNSPRWDSAANSVRVVALLIVAAVFALMWSSAVHNANGKVPEGVTRDATAK